MANNDMETTPTTVLIVDDDPMIIKLLTWFLEGTGFLCRTAESAEQARRVFSEQPLDLLLTDLDMPGDSGLDLIRFAKARYPQTAAVMVTIIDDPEQAREALDLGVYGYIIKPFTRNQVLITVENALRHHRLEMQQQLNTVLLEREVAARTRRLDEQLAFFQTLIDTIPVPIYYKDTDCVYLGCNRAFEESIDRVRQDIIGRKAEDLYPIKLAKALNRKDRELLDRGGVQVYEKDVIRPDGTQHSEITHKACFHDRLGRVAGLVGVRFDITELKETERSLRLSEEKLSSIMDNLHIGVAMISPQMRLLQVNRQMMRWFPDAMPGTQDFCHQMLRHDGEQEACALCPVKRVFSLGGAHEAFSSMRTAQGNRTFRLFGSPISDANGDIVAAIMILEDVTEKMTIERELQQAQKLEAIGQLAAGIAHEINTPVQYIGDNVRFLGEAFHDLIAIQGKFEHLMVEAGQGRPINDLIPSLAREIEQADVPYLVEEVPKTVEQTIDGLERVGKIVRAMREFSHPGSEEKVAVDINRALESTLTVSRNEWKYVADVETDFAPDLPPLFCLPGEINQVFLNIIVNAAHAISDATEGGSRGKGVIGISTHTNNGWMEIRISDTGGGIPEAVRHRIFEPFFTTKQVGKGTGQGLVIARSAVVDKHHGSLRFETEAGKGTTFIIQLPLAPPASHKAK